MSSPPRSELDRLLIQARAWAPAATSLLDQLGVGPGWACADLGCGPIGILDLLARRVGRRGRVVGVDRQPAALLAALEATRRLPNVTLVPAALPATGLPRGSFDFVHARFVGQETGAGPLVDEMLALVRPGGWIALEEPGRDPWTLDPAPPDYERIAPRVAGRFLRRRGAVGPALLDRLRRRGLRRIGSRIHQLTFRGGHPYASMPAFALAGARAWLASHGVPRPILARLAESLAAAATDRRVGHRSFPLWQVWGRRPA